MQDSIKELVVSHKETLLDALNRIDNNKKGFLIVLSDDEKIVGVLTDGDIRRFIISNYETLTSKRLEDICCKEYEFLRNDQAIKDAMNIFQKDGIQFLPIVDSENRLENVITKNQLHSLLLRDLHVNLDYDFQSVEVGILDYEIVSKPWGFYKTMVFNDYFQSKVLSIQPGERISLQVHKQREEYWTIVHGFGEVQIGESKKTVEMGDYVFVPKNCQHSIRNKSSVETLVVSETQIGDYLGEDDIVRIEDSYGRV